MANRTHYLQYYIHLTDKAAFNAAVASVAGTAGWLVETAPDDVAVTYGAAVIVPPGAFAPPCLTSAYFTEQLNYPLDVARFTRRSGGWFGLPFLFGDTHTYIWAGSFMYAGTDNGEGEIPAEVPVAMATRRWVDGFENQAAAGAVTGTGGSERQSPAASRHMGGYGWSARNGQTFVCTHHLIEAGGAVDNKGWERLYVRLKSFPTSSQTFWQSIGAVSSLAGIRLRFGVGGTIEVVNSDPAGTLTGLGATAALVIGQWYKLDLLYRSGAAPDSFFKLYQNGVAVFSVTGGSLPAGTGLTQVQNITGSQIRDGNSTGHNGSWDIDDWIGMQLPLGGANPALFPARDWNSGSKVIALTGQAAAASNSGNYAGIGGLNANDWRLTTQRPITNTSTPFTLTTASVSQRLAVVSDAARRIDFDPLNRGIIAVQVCCFSARGATGALDATVGFKLPTAGEVTGTIVTESVAVLTLSNGKLLFNGASIEPTTPTAGTELSYTGSTGAGTKVLGNLYAQAECIGIFHPEDYVPQTGDPAGFTTGLAHWNNIPHHHRYYDGPNAMIGTGSPSIAVIHARTYTGNSTSQQFAFRVPPTWIFIRNTATHQSTMWFASAPGAAGGSNVSINTHLITRAFIDPNFTPAAEDDQSQQTIVEVVGNSVQNNLNAVLYEMIAFCDPGMRFSEAGALVEETASLEARTTLLNNTELLPEFFMGLRQQLGNTTTKALLLKGIGAPANNVYLCNAALLNNAMTFGTGSLATTTLSSIYLTLQIQSSFVVWRRDDGSGDPGVNNVLQIATWTGDGAASRSVNFSPASGRRPMWAMVMGSNGVTRARDASHTGTTSLQVASDSSDGTTGITAGGIDQITVGSALNTNAIIFEAICFPSCDATAGNNGWGIDCENIPVEPTSTPPSGTPPVPPVEPGGTTPCGTPGLTPTGTITQCAGPSTLVINTALSRIGVSKQLTSTTLNTEVSPEATVARLNFDEDVRQILRDFPWPFATRYEVVTQVAGPASESDTVQAYVSTQAYIKNSVVRVSGVDYYCILAHSTAQAVTNPTYWTTVEPEEANGDWLYAYRSPAYDLFNRRIINTDAQTRRTWDQSPPDFRVGSDANGPLVYSNTRNATLEYTIMDGCAATQGDALFRSALAWRHAASLAPALTRDEKIAAYCWAMYQRLLNDARGSGAQEQQQAPQGDTDWISGRA